MYATYHLYIIQTWWPLIGLSCRHARVSKGCGIFKLEVGGRRQVDSVALRRQLTHEEIDRLIKVCMTSVWLSRQ